jgi:hypothetical protein
MVGANVVSVRLGLSEGISVGFSVGLSDFGDDTTSSQVGPGDAVGAIVGIKGFSVFANVVDSFVGVVILAKIAIVVVSVIFVGVGTPGNNLSTPLLSSPLVIFVGLTIVLFISFAISVVGLFIDTIGEAVGLDCDGGDGGTNISIGSSSDTITLSMQQNKTKRNLNEIKNIIISQK